MKNKKMKSACRLHPNSRIKKSIYYFVLMLMLSTHLSAQDSLYTREYKLGYYNQNDLRNSSENFITINRAINDGFRKGVKPLMNEKLGEISYGLFNFASTYMSLIWSHEFGHVLRAEQVGGKFKIHNGNLPIPYTTMHLPDNVSLFDETLSVTGGFEVNYLTVRSLQREFITQNELYNEDLGLSFAHRIMYPLYTFIIVPMNPEDPEVWRNPAGDPAHCALLTFRNYSDENVFVGTDSTVNSDLVKYYWQSTLLGSLFNLLDPNFYREFGGTFGNSSKNRKPIFLIGNNHSGWTYGTLFNVSPLGYELYLNNYIHVKGNKFSAYLKYGNPFKNNGFGIGWYEIMKNPKLNMSAFIDVWNQDYYGSGISGEVSASYKISKRIGANINLGYKTRGYVLGKQTQEGLNLGLSISYLASY